MDAIRKIEEMPPLPEPDVFQGLKLLPFEYRWFHIRENAERLGYPVEKVFYSEESMHTYARDYAAQILAIKEAELVRLMSEMRRYLPVLERLEDMPAIWNELTAGTGIATVNGYRAAITQPTE